MSDSRAEDDAPRVLKNKWRLDRVIGAGGMAVVYEATHRNGMRAAVKMLRRELSWEPELRGRFLREGYLANTVGHPGVPQVFDDDIDEDGSVFLVMELLVGETAEAARKRAGGRLPVDEVVGIGIDTLDVLAAAHDKGVVHRDIKPDNLFINSDGHLKVLDFGIARVRAAQGTHTQTGSLLGTPAYMSPEQARGHWEDVDARTDLWAVGATLFTLLSGQFVHTGRTGAEALVEAVTKPARALASVAPEVPEELCAIVDRALVFSRDERWPSARAMQEALLAFRRRTAPTPTVATTSPSVDGEETRAATEFPLPTAPGRTAAPSSESEPGRQDPDSPGGTSGDVDEGLYSTASARAASSRRRAVAGVGLGGLAVMALVAFALRRAPAPAALPTPAAASSVHGPTAPALAATPAPTAIQPPTPPTPLPATAPPPPERPAAGQPARTTRVAAATAPRATAAHRAGTHAGRPVAGSGERRAAAPASDTGTRPPASSAPAKQRPPRPEVDLYDSRR